MSWGSINLYLYTIVSRAFHDCLSCVLRAIKRRGWIAKQNVYIQIKVEEISLFRVFVLTYFCLESLAIVSKRHQSTLYWICWKSKIQSAIAELAKIQFWVHDAKKVKRGSTENLITAALHTPGQSISLSFFTSLKSIYIQICLTSFPGMESLTLNWKSHFKVVPVAKWRTKKVFSSGSKAEMKFIFND